MRNTEKALPTRTWKANKPWIDFTTLALIDRRTEARKRNESAEEARLHKEIRQQAKLDRTCWMDRFLADGSWNEINKIRRPKEARQGKLRDQHGDLVETDQWAGTMARHLASVQWQMRPASLID